ncbi:hypothetical protein PRZ48_013560 [Zasmidium cellare]|uniref:Uncharacterized protein n=1 Tax=Zasmidium cellare TaxID=395010 RepID=A0ABR0E1W9_ZASCE|nr:hypothetical protein PRZ48_013560 [Zasmidium cellare]
MMALIQGDIKPVYGPLPGIKNEQPMTPTIFAAKWISKFRPLIHNYFIRPPNPTTSRVWMCIFCDLAWEHLTNFYTQAAALSLTTKDIPADDITGPEVWMPREPHEVDALFMRGIRDPFPVAEVMMGLVEKFLLRFEAMKTKGERLYGTMWGDLPLKWRRRVVELIPLVDKAKEEGWWDGSEKFFQGGVFKMWEDGNTFR